MDPPVTTIPSEALDRGTCGVSDRHIDTLLSGHEKSVDDIDKDRYDALRLKNSLLPFHQIPPEIHADILLFALVDALEYNEVSYIYMWDCEQYYKQLHIYAQVSCLWKSLVLNTPILWNKISGKMDRQLCSTALARSKGCLLDVEYIGHVETPDVFSLIAPTVQRWGSIALQCDTEQETATWQSILEQPMPHLWGATLVWEEAPPPSPVNLGAGQPRLLECLAIFRVPILWDSRVLLGLRSLVMYSIDSHTPTWTQLHDLFQSAVHMESLVMIDVRVSGLSMTFGPSVPINLPSFRNLFLKRVDPLLVRNMFEAFHFPSCDTCNVKAYVENNSFRDTFTSATNHMLPIFGRLVNTSEEVRIVMDHYECVICATINFPTRKVLRVCVRGVADPHEFSKWISGMGIVEKSPGAISLDLGLLDVQTDTTPTEAGVASHGLEPGKPLTKAALEALKSDIDHLSIVSKLRFQFGHARIDPLLEYLTPPSRALTDEVEKWPLPLLQELSIRGNHFTPGCLVGMLRARCGRGSPLPKPLVRLEVTGCKNFPGDLKEEVDQLLGPSMFSCW